MDAQEVKKFKINKNEPTSKTVFSLQSIVIGLFTRNELEFNAKQVTLIQNLPSSFGITEIHGVYRSKTQLFYIVDKPKGSRETLSQFLIKQEEPLNLEVIKKIALQLLMTLETLHDQGIVHLDLNPDNILITDASSLLDSSHAPVPIKNKRQSEDL